MALIASLPSVGAADAQDAPASLLTPVQVQLHWLHQFEFAGFYVAIENGFYAEAGLDVSLLTPPASDFDVTAPVLSGDVAFGVGYSSIIYDYLNGENIVALSALLQNSPLVLIAPKNGGVETIADLRGKRVMMAGDSLRAAPIMALLFQNGLGSGSITRVPHSYQIADLFENRVDASTAFLSNEPFLARRQGQELTVFDPSDSGIEFYENLIFTSQDFAKAEPDLVGRFVATTERGWAHALANIDEAIAIIQDQYDDQDKSADALRYEAETLSQLAKIPGRPLGHINVQKLERMLDVYRVTLGALPDRRLDDFLWRRDVDQGLVLSDEERDFISGRVIRVATTSNWRPFSFASDETGTPRGIGYEFWRQVASKAGIQYENIVRSQFPDITEGIKARTYDLTLSVGLSAERDAYAAFTQPYAEFPIAIATSKDQNFISDIDEIATEILAVGEGFTAHQLVAAAYPDLNLMLVENVKAGLQAVSDDRAFAFLDIEPVLSHAIARYGFNDLRISGHTGVDFEVRMMMREDYGVLASIIDKYIAAMPASLKLDIVERFMPIEYAAPVDLSRFYIYGAAVSGLALLVSGWFFYTKKIETRASRAKSEFLAHMSHDLRTPLNAIMGFSDVMRSEQFGAHSHPKYKDYANDIYRSAELLGHLVNDILDLEKIETNRYSIQETSLDLLEMVDLCVQQCAALRRDVHIRVLNLSGSEALIIRADKRALVQVLNNIVSNAVKFSQAGGEVRIHVAERAADGVSIGVEDDGLGMTAAELKRIGAPFQQTESAQVSKFQGSGLGLYISKQLIALMGGDLTIESEHGVGTRVLITLPNAQIGA